MCVCVCVIREECSRREQRVSELEAKLRDECRVDEMTSLCVNCGQSEAAVTYQLSIDTLTRSVVVTISVFLCMSLSK